MRVATNFHEYWHFLIAQALVDGRSIHTRSCPKIKDIAQSATFSKNMKEGPRQSKRNQQYLQQAEMELLSEKKAREERERNTIEAARFDATGRGVVATSVPASRPSCLDVGLDFGKNSNETSENSAYWYEPNSFAKDDELCDGKAITFWSTGANRPSFPAKSCGFTNPLEDGRLHHDEGTDYPLYLD